MTLEQIKGSSVKTVAKWLKSVNACPLENAEEDVCVVKEDGCTDCQRCWEMHLNGESREQDGEDPKETGRGYRV